MSNTYFRSTFHFQTDAIRAVHNLVNTNQPISPQMKGDYIRFIRRDIINHPIILSHFSSE